MAIADIDWLPKQTRGPAKAFALAIIVFLGGATGYHWLDTAIVTKAHAAAKSEIQPGLSALREDMKAVREDARYTRCAVAVHIRGGDLVDLMDCENGQSK